MSCIQKKIGRHINTQENINPNPEKNQPIDSDLQITEMIKLADRMLKLSITNMLHSHKRGKHEHDERY